MCRVGSHHHTQLAPSVVLPVAISAVPFECGTSSARGRRGRGELQAHIPLD